MTTTMVIKSLIREGIDEREKGCLKESVRVLVEAYNKIDSAKPYPNYNDDLISIHIELGLTYFRQGEIEKAASQWKKARIFARVHDYPGLEAIALGNLSRKELWETDGELEGALVLSIKALKLAKKNARIDLPWFYHALFSAASSLGTDEEEKKPFLKEMLSKEKYWLKKVWDYTPKLKRRMWLTAYMMDWAVVNRSIAKPTLTAALMISKLFKLKGREEKIKKLRDEI